MDPHRGIEGVTKSVSNDPNDPRIVVWTQLQVPPGEELDTDHWAGHFQPLLHALGHQSTAWARVQGSPNLVILATLWYTTSELRDFMASPSAQLYAETLASAAIVPLNSYETIYGEARWFRSLSRSFTQLFRVYFPAPVTPARQAEISRLRGMRPPALGFSIPQSQSLQTCRPVQLWVNQTQDLYGREAQLVLWLHFWRDAEKAEWRFLSKGTQSTMEEFIEDLEKVGPMEWREEFYVFKTLPRF